MKYALIELIDGEILDTIPCGKLHEMMELGVNKLHSLGISRINIDEFISKGYTDYVYQPQSGIEFVQSMTLKQLEWND
jgi:hypothetical protein